jgi:hypothetical protein
MNVMNPRIFQTFATLILCFSAAVAEEKPLSAYSNDEFIELIEQGGDNLIKDHGDDLLSLLYFRKKPTDAELLEATANPSVLKEKKRDLPVFQALRNAENATIELLRHSSFFDLPQHQTDLEVIAYLLHDILGHDGATSFVQDRIKEGTAYANENWLAIASLLERPKLASGHFIVEKTAKGSKVEPDPEIEQLRKERIQLKYLLTTIPAEDISAFLGVHCKFRKVLEACLKHRSTKGNWPTSLYRLIDDGNLKESQLLFLDTDGFLYVPRFREAVDDDSQESVLNLVTPDGKFTIRGFLDGTIDVAQVDRK